MGERKKEKKKRNSVASNSKKKSSCFDTRNSILIRRKCTTFPFYKMMTIFKKNWYIIIMTFENWTLPLLPVIYFFLYYRLINIYTHVTLRKRLQTLLVSLKTGKKKKKSQDITSWCMGKIWVDSLVLDVVSIAERKWLLMRVIKWRK